MENFDRQGATAQRKYVMFHDRAIMVHGVCCGIKVSRVLMAVRERSSQIRVAKWAVIPMGRGFGGEKIVVDSFLATVVVAESGSGKGVAKILSVEFS